VKKCALSKALVNMDISAVEDDVERKTHGYNIAGN
jgi:hypothetical protein